MRHWVGLVQLFQSNVWITQSIIEIQDLIPPPKVLMTFFTCVKPCYQRFPKINPSSYILFMHLVHVFYPNIYLTDSSMLNPTRYPSSSTFVHLGTAYSSLHNERRASRRACRHNWLEGERCLVHCEQLYLMIHQYPGF